MENKALNTNEKILLLGILHYVVAIVLIIIKFVPFNVSLSDILLTEQTYAVLLADSIIMGSILYALSGSLQKNLKKFQANLQK
jgi:hypothetical protein